MLVEHTIKFELSESGPPGRTCTSINGYFQDKTKIFKENLQVDYYLLLNNCRRRCILLYFPLHGLTHLQNLSPKCKILNVFWA